MKRTWSDLHFCPDIKNSTQTTRMIEKASVLGYRQIAIPFSERVSHQEINKARITCKDFGIDLATRVDLNARNPDDLLRQLRKFRREYELIGVLCFSKTVARQAAKDRRVDLLNFPGTEYRNRFFDAAEAELASASIASFEIDLLPLLMLEGSNRIRLLSRLRREVSIARGSHVPIVVSSGAHDETHLRAPMESASLTSLFDLEKETAVIAVSTSATTMVRRNREKLSSGFVAPGIRVVRRGKDC